MAEMLKMKNCIVLIQLFRLVTHGADYLIYMLNFRCDKRRGTFIADLTVVVVTFQETRHLTRNETEAH